MYKYNPSLVVQKGKSNVLDSDCVNVLYHSELDIRQISIKHSTSFSLN